MSSRFRNLRTQISCVNFEKNPYGLDSLMNLDSASVEEYVTYNVEFIEKMVRQPQVDFGI